MNKRRRFLSLGLRAGAAGLGVGLSGLSTDAWASPGTSVEVSLARPRVGVGQQAMISVKVTTQDGSDPPRPSFAAVKGLHIQALNNTTSFSTSMSFGRGQAARRRASQDYKYIVWADAPGEYTISPKVQVPGGFVEPQDLPVLQVVAGGPEAAMPGALGTSDPSGAGGSTTPEGVERGQPFLVTSLEPDEIWLGESFRYIAEVHKPRQRGSRSYLLQIDEGGDLPGAIKTDLPDTKARIEQVDGMAYQVERFMDTLVTPQRAGELVVPAPRGQAQLVEQVFFDTRALAEAISISGQERTVTIKALPAAGQPKNFRPFNVGQLKIETKVDRTRVPAGEGLTLELVISGQGNLALIEPDAWPDLPAGVRRYEPEVGDPQRSFRGSKLHGSRSWKFLIIPDGGGKFTIAAHTLHYFDPVTASYKVARSEAIEIVVEGDPALAPTGAQAGASSGSAGDASDRGEAAKAANSTLDEDAPLAPIRGGDRLSREALIPPNTGAWLSRDRWSWLSAGVPLAFAATWFGQRAWARFGPDESARSRAAQLRWRRGQLERAAALVARGEGFWPALAELLQRAAVERAGPEAQGQTRGALARRLAGLGIEPAQISTWRALLDRADEARFGAADPDQGATARSEALDAARALLETKEWAPQ